MHAQAPDSPHTDSTARVLFVEDNQSLVAYVFAYLEGKGHILDAAPDGVSGLQLALENEYDVIVLDWMLPRLEGIEVLRRLRTAGSDVPVLMLTARDELDSKLTGFRNGADDYLAKPFAIAELEARIIALSLRRRGRKRTLRVGNLRYDVTTQEIYRGDRLLQLHTGCRTILEMLMRESPGIVAKERLEAAIWGDERPDRDLLRTHIYELRRRLEIDGEPKLLYTVKSVGYRLSSSDANS
ncbi:response regulator transcription factor [Lysobacter sp. CA196]|uniref:response regulator transcription factor n=1 Tax=Lysobacter sp. CA196 TaxID=3455606 RepID=UPI003F8D1277